jgi:hypothetical protein
LRSSVEDVIEKLKSSSPPQDSRLASKARPSKTYDADLVEPAGGGSSGVR